MFDTLIPITQTDKFPCTDVLYGIHAHGDLVYVGKSKNMQRRFESGHHVLLRVLQDFPSSALTVGWRKNESYKEDSVIAELKPRYNGSPTRHLRGNNGGGRKYFGLLGAVVEVRPGWYAARLNVEGEIEHLGTFPCKGWACEEVNERLEEEWTRIPLFKTPNPPYTEKRRIG